MSQKIKGELMKSEAVHYMNKYPKAVVIYDENKLDVLADGLKVALRRDGHGKIVDVSAEMGAQDKHDMSPIPKNARVFKLYDSGKIAKAEEAEERMISRKQILVEDKVLSIAEYRAKKDLYEVSAEGEVKPKASAQVQAEE